MKILELFRTHAVPYDQWYDTHHAVFESEIQAVKEYFELLPENIHGIEVGLGSGRFSHRLGIKEGVEPCAELAAMAQKRGIEVIHGFAEDLPYKALQFDFVLFVTICFLRDFKQSVKEAHRVLKPGGRIIVGFLDKDRDIAMAYKDKENPNVFYEHAQFYPAALVKERLEEQGFKGLVCNQTLFGGLDEIQEIQNPIQGYGQGSFVVISGKKMS